MSISTMRACLALHHHSHLSDTQLRALLRAVSEPAAVFDLDEQAICNLGLVPSVKKDLVTAFRQRNSPAVERDHLILDRCGIDILAINSAHYPALLREIFDPPVFIYVQGALELLNTPQLAIVGSRLTTRQGMQNAYDFAKAFGEAGLTVTSGLALGVDAESHRGALAATGNTIGVLGTGIDVVYPRRNRELFGQLIERGLIVSEYPLGRGARKGQFPKRNRIISGLSLGVLVVEAAVQSGSLITARCALEQGREVFAIPGSIHSPTSRGCHALIREGATLVETVAHVVEELGAWLPDNTQASHSYREQLSVIDDLDECHKRILACLGFDPATVDLLQQRLGLPMSELMPGLTQLELKGVVENKGGHYLRIVK